MRPAVKYRSPTRGCSNLAAVACVSWAAFLAACLTLWTLAPGLISVQDHLLHNRSFSEFSLHAHAVVQHNRRMQQVPAALVLATAHGSPAGSAQLAQQSPNLSGPTNTSAATADTSQHPCVEQETQRAGMQRPMPQQKQQQPPVSPVLDLLHGLPADLVGQIGPVDIVYSWVNGSDPVLDQELQELHDHQQAQSVGKASTATQGKASKHTTPHPLENPARKSRFDVGCDELRYSLRSVERYLPWFRHIYIVTNGQVPTWLATNNNRSTVVPHSSIFERAADLPTFNSAAIQANIANIPGLSDTFIMMDDDFFLTESWTLRDFITPDGGQTLTGSTWTSKVKVKGNLYLQRTVNTATIFELKFGPHPRYDPAHAPRLLQKRYLRQLQQQMPEEFERTSLSRLRSPTDLVIPSAYMWYVSQFQNGSHPIAPDKRTSFMTTNTIKAMAYMGAADTDFRARVKAKDLNATTYAATHAWKKDSKPLAIQQATEYEGKLPQHGPALARCEQTHLLDLVKAWSHPGSKVVCLNDDVDDYASVARPLMASVVRIFLAARYSKPSAFELSNGRTNGCNGRLPRTSFGRLPGPAEVTGLCSSHAPAATLQTQKQPQEPAERTESAATPQLSPFTANIAVTLPTAPPVRAAALAAVPTFVTVAA